MGRAAKPRSAACFQILVPSSVGTTTQTEEGDLDFCFPFAPLPPDFSPTPSALSSTSALAAVSSVEPDLEMMLSTTRPWLERWVRAKCASASKVGPSTVSANTSWRLGLSRLCCGPKHAWLTASAPRFEPPMPTTMVSEAGPQDLACARDWRRNLSSDARSREQAGWFQLFFSTACRSSER
ncbi:Uncharacterised protein [uncultured archaeon]|nr:Uncharacterised protein [uncultured archaeon]